MDYTDILYEQRGDAAWITLNRPEVLNAIRWETGDQLRDAVARADRDDSVRFLVLSGAGRGFCSGDDIKAIWQAEGFQEGQQERRFDKYRKPFEAWGQFLFDVEKPIVAAVHGIAVGLGMELAIAADIRVASDQARFGYFFVRRGLIGSATSLYYLPRIVGLGRAYELLLSGRLVQAEEAERIGLVSRVVPEDELTAAVESTLDELRQAAPMSQRAVKRIMRQGLTNDPAVVDEFSYQVLDTLFQSADHREAVSAFAERRAAEFRNG